MSSTAKHNIHFGSVRTRSGAPFLRVWMQVWVEPSLYGSKEFNWVGTGVVMFD